MDEEIAAQEPPFDYDSLDEQAREIVRRKTDETHGLMKRTAENIIAIGQNLLAVQQHLPEMKYSAWLRAEFDLSRQSAYNFMRVASRFGGSCKTVLQLPARVLYELASSSDAIVAQVEAGQLSPTVAAIKAAKEAERLARAEVQAQHVTIEQLTRDLEGLRQRLADLAVPEGPVRAVETGLVPPEATAQLETLQGTVTVLTQQRDSLTQQVAELQEQVSSRAAERDAGEHERRVRLDWYRLTNEFQRSLRAILSQWPSPIDVLAFEADDWIRLSQTKQLARRFLAECDQLTQETEGQIVDGARGPSAD